MKFSLQIPYFPGFYGSIFDLGEVEYNCINEEIDYYQETYGKKLSPEDFTFDWRSFQNDVCKLWCSYYLSEYGLPFIKDVKFDALDSPREYNFRTDELYGLFDLEDNWKDCMRSFMMENYNELQETIHEEWSSRDGFFSFMSNDIDDWDKFLFEEEDERYISQMIKYMTIHEYDSFDNIMGHLEMCVYDDLCESEYLSIDEVETEE